MPKKASAMLGSEVGEALGEGDLQIVEGARGRLAQVGLEFGERLFDGVEIRAVGGQVAHARSASRDQFHDRGGLVDAQVVEDDDIAGFELWAKHLAHIDREDFGIGGARDQEGRIDPLPAQRGDKGGGLPVAVRHGSDAALPPETASVQTRQLGVERGLIDENQPPVVPARLVPAPPGPGESDIRPLLLGGVRRFFYSSDPAGRAGATAR